MGRLERWDEGASNQVDFPRSSYRHAVPRHPPAFSAPP